MQFRTHTNRPVPVDLVTRIYTSETAAKPAVDTIFRMRAPAVLLLLTTAARACPRGARRRRVVASCDRPRRWSPSTARARSSRSARPSPKSSRRPTPGVRVTVGISGTGGGFQKFCRGETDISNASRPITRQRDRGVRQGRHRLHRAAGRLRRPRHRGEPQGHLGRRHHRRRAEDDLGARGAGQGRRAGRRCAPAGPTASSTCSAPASTRAPTTTSPRRSSARKAPAAATSRRARTTTCSSRASPATSSRSASCPTPTTPRTRRALKLVPVDDGKADNGAGPIAAERRDREGRHLPAAVAPALHLRVDRGARPARGGAASSTSTCAKGGALAEEVGYVPLGDRGYQLVAEHFKARKTGSVFEHAGSQVGLTIEQLLASARRE